MEDFRTYIGKKLRSHIFQEWHVKGDYEPFMFKMEREMDMENRRIWSYEHDRHPRHKDFKEFLQLKNIDLPDGKIDNALRNNIHLALEYWAWTWSGKKKLAVSLKYDLVEISLTE